MNGKNVHYKISGRGETLVLLHGYLESLEMWSEHQEFLSNKYQVISIDLPGHGLTDNFGDIHTMSFMAEVVYEILQDEKVEKCVMVGHSMGGYTTLAFAEKYPQILKGLGLFHSHASADTDVAKRNRERTIEIIKQDKGHFINEFIPSLFAPDNVEKFADQIEIQMKMANAMPKESVIAAMAGMKERSSTVDILMDSKVPVLFIAGKHDSRIPLEKTLAQAALPTISQILILGDAGHMSWTEEEQKTIAELDGFMQLCND
ncbi:MAG: alpha/beta hydrolase [Bacteroidales bacterium]|nr:alpha/beta hydrolase [Bacteroidales bacterium]